MKWIESPTAASGCQRRMALLVLWVVAQQDIDLMEQPPFGVDAPVQKPDVALGESLPADQTAQTLAQGKGRIQELLFKPQP